MWCEQAAEREKAQYKIAVFGAWHGALYARQKRLPELGKIMRRFHSTSPIDPPSPKTLLAKARAITRILGGRDLTQGAR